MNLLMFHYNDSSNVGFEISKSLQPVGHKMYKSSNKEEKCTSLRLQKLKSKQCNFVQLVAALVTNFQSRCNSQIVSLQANHIPPLTLMSQHLKTIAPESCAFLEGYILMVYILCKTIEMVLYPKKLGPI